MGSNLIIRRRKCLVLCKSFNTLWLSPSSANDLYSSRMGESRENNASTDFCENGNFAKPIVFATIFLHQGGTRRLMQSRLCIIFYGYRAYTRAETKSKVRDWEIKSTLAWGCPMSMINVLESTLEWT